MNKLQRSVIDASYKLGWGHIPSALSMVGYLYEIRDIVADHDIWIIGKPYGSQAYYTAFGDDDISQYERVIKTGDIIAGRTVDFADNTFGDCLSVAVGYALANPKSKIWVNVSDTAFDVGKFLEACKFIGLQGLSNIFMTVDCNNYSVNNETDRIDAIEPIMTELGWHVYEYDRYDTNICKPSVRPTLYVFNTIKGDGVPMMEEDPVMWHYKTITDSIYYDIKEEDRDDNY